MNWDDGDIENYQPSVDGSEEILIFDDDCDDI